MSLLVFELKILLLITFLGATTMASSQQAFNDLIDSLENITEHF